MLPTGAGTQMLEEDELAVICSARLLDSYLSDRVGGRRAAVDLYAKVTAFVDANAGPSDDHRILVQIFMCAYSYPEQIRSRHAELMLGRR